MPEYDHDYKWSPDGPECDLCGEMHVMENPDPPPRHRLMTILTTVEVRVNFAMNVFCDPLCRFFHNDRGQYECTLFHNMDLQAEQKQGKWYAIRCAECLELARPVVEEAASG